MLTRLLMPEDRLLIEKLHSAELVAGVLLTSVGPCEPNVYNTDYFACVLQQVDTMSETIA